MPDSGGSSFSATKTALSVSAASLVNGPITLYTPPASKMNVMAFDYDTYTAMDNPFEEDVKKGSSRWFFWQVCSCSLPEH